MSLQFSLPQNAQVVEILNPAADAAGRTGAYVTLKNMHKAWLVFHITQGNAATIQLSVNQATTVTGTSAKAITVATPIWSDLDTSTNDTLTARTAAVNYTTDAGLKNKIVVFEINPADLDVANGFDCITGVTGASNAANITECILYGVNNRFMQATPPSAVVN